MRLIIFFLLFLLFFISANDRGRTHVNQKVSELIDRSSILHEHDIEWQKYRELDDSQIDRTVRTKLLLLATSYIYFNENAKSKIIIDRALSSAQHDNDVVDIYKSYLIYGKYYLSVDNNLSYIYLSKAIRGFTSLGLHTELAKTYYHLANLYYNTNSYYNSQVSALHSLKLARKYHLKMAEINSLVFLGMCSSELGEYKSALFYHELAIHKLEEYDLPKKTFLRENCLNNLGYNYFVLGDSKKALEFFYDAITNIASEDEYPELYARLIENIATAKLAMNPKYNALSPYYEAASLRARFAIKAGVNYNLFLQSKSLYSVGRKKDAILTCKKAIRESYSFGALKDAEYLIAYLLTINDKHSSSIFREYKNLHNSLKLTERRTKNKFARIAFEAEELERQTQEASQKQWLIGAVGTGIGVLILFALLLKVNAARKRRVQMIQEQHQIDEHAYQILHDQEIQINRSLIFEKQRIARELHDDVMNRLASTRLNLFSLRSRRDPETIKKCLGYVRQIEEIERDLLQISESLGQDHIFDRSKFSTLLQKFVADFTSGTIINVMILNSGVMDLDTIDNTIKIHFFRIIQEALHNCRKYANATTFKITFEKPDNERIHLHISDDGVGFNSELHSDGIGLANMRTRVKDLNGLFSIESDHSTGTIIRIAIPLRHEFTKSA